MHSIQSAFSILQQTVNYNQPGIQKNKKYSDLEILEMHIEQVFYHPIEIKNVNMMYKLNVKLKKPIILSLHSLQVIKHINEHQQCLKSILSMETVTELKILVPGYGIFNQKYQLEDLSGFFKALVINNFKCFQTIKKISFEFPGWRTFTVPILANIMGCIGSCIYLEELKINLNHCVNLIPVTQANKHEETFYNSRTFGVKEFQFLLQQICSIQSHTLIKLDMQMGAWEGVNTEIFQILIENLGKMNDHLTILSVLELNLNGWGINSQTSEKQKNIEVQVVNKFFQCFQQYTELELLIIDIRNWQESLKNIKSKERLRQLSGGGVKKQENTSTMYMFSMTGTYFGSQIKNKFKNMKVQIIQ